MLACSIVAAQALNHFVGQSCNDFSATGRLPTVELTDSTCSCIAAKKTIALSQYDMCPVAGRSDSGHGPGNPAATHENIA
jgi:hypothetical protein